MDCTYRKKRCFDEVSRCEYYGGSCCGINYFRCHGWIWAILFIALSFAAVSLWQMAEDRVEAYSYRKNVSHNQQRIADIQASLGTFTTEFHRSFRPLEVEATGYCNCEVCINVPKWRDGKTKTLKQARVGYIAVDPTIIPLGSMVYIDGMGIYFAEDIGDDVKGNRIDIFFNTHQEALEFGRKKLRVWVAV